MIHSLVLAPLDCFRNELETMPRIELDPRYVDVDVRLVKYMGESFGVWIVEKKKMPCPDEIFILRF
jgi:hypothetical protein